MIVIRCPECEKKHGEIIRLEGFVYLTIQCKNKGDRRPGHARPPCGALFEFKLPNPEIPGSSIADGPYRRAVKT